MRKLKVLWLALLLLPCTALAQWQIGNRSFYPTTSGGTTPTLDGSICVNPNLGSAESISCTFSVPTAGDTIVVGMASEESGTFTVTDSNGKTYTQIWTASDPTTPVFEAMFYLPNSASGSITVTGTITVSGGEMGIWAQPIKGANTSTPLDSTFSSGFVATSSGSVANGNCGTARTPSQANTLIFSTGFWDNVTPSVGANYTLLNSTDFFYVQTWSQITAAPTNGAWVSSTDDWVVGCAGFHS